MGEVLTWEYLYSVVFLFYLQNKVQEQELDLKRNRHSDRDLHGNKHPNVAKMASNSSFPGALGGELRPK